MKTDYTKNPSGFEQSFFVTGLWVKCGLEPNTDLNLKEQWDMNKWGCLLFLFSLSKECTLTLGYVQITLIKHCHFASFQKIHLLHSWLQ
jgi:hypothetical protein